jgi:hypothetical protein
MRAALISAGVRHLKEFGYPNCTATNIVTDRVYCLFFRRMLEGTRDDPEATQPIKAAAKELLREMDNVPKPKRSK